MAEDTGSISPEESFARAEAFRKQIEGDPEKKTMIENVLGHKLNEQPKQIIREPLDYSWMTEDNARIYVDYRDKEKEAGKKPLEFDEFTKSPVGKEYAKKWKAAQVLDVSL